MSQLKLFLYLWRNVTKNKMKKALKITLKVIGVLLALLLLGGLIGYIYVSNTFLDFEDDYQENKNLKELAIESKTFVDRNGNGKLDVYEDPSMSIESRVEDVLSQMTLEEKIHLLKGSGLASAMGIREDGIPGVVGTIVATPRLGLPEINLSDGPAGLRIEPIREGEERTFYCTAFPIATLLASTWNTDLVQEVGDAMGNEALEYGIDVILGPGANIHRHPFCGRNFEYYSEDPLLTGKIGAAMVNGIESNGVGTSVKHFVANNQETNRNFNDTRISERALREIYLKGFEIIVEESQPWTIMSSYNKVNGTYTSESKFLLTDILRNEWGFEGLVMSDWFGGNDAVAMINAGNDLLEPGTNKQWKALKKGAEEGTLNEEEVNKSVERILTLVFNSQKMKGYDYSENPDLKAHAKITRESASEGMVLLKNKEALPISNSMNVALIGVTSYDFIAGGTGSGDVNEAYTISLEDGLKNNGFSINETAKSVYEKHRVANKKAFEKPEGINAMFEPYNPPQIQYTDDLIQEIEETSDVAIVTIGRNSGEGGDRVESNDFKLSDVEIEMLSKTVETFHKTDKKVIVVLNIGGVVETASWKEIPDAILLAWQGGQEGGNAVADILSGKVNPSGKLTMTFPIQLNDHASNANFPQGGVPMKMTYLLTSPEIKSEDELIKDIDYTAYTEGIFVGYRHFDTKKIEVSYPFGFGLSYTQFLIDNIEATIENDTISIKTTVQNIGGISGKEVVQIYISKPNSKIERASQELKSFSKTKLLAPQEIDTLTFYIPKKELGYWNEKDSKWEIEPGDYKVKVGSSSRNISKEAQITLE